MLSGILEEIDISKIKKPTFYYRSSSSSANNMSLSIMRRGLLHPIIVRPLTAGFEIIAGVRRFEACKSLGWRKILCHIIELTDKEAFEVSLIENTNRKNLDPLDEAHAFRDYAVKYGWGGMSELAKKIGKSVHYVERRVRLLSLPIDVLESIKSHDINVSMAEELISINNGYDQSSFAKVAQSQTLSSRKLRELVKEFRNNKNLESEGVDSFYSAINDMDRLVQRAFDKSITIMKMSLHKLTSVMEDVEENWIIYEMLRQHRNVIHEQIDLLIKEKKKL